jgi:polar amino acid transport system substrate-binding protein
MSNSATTKAGASGISIISVLTLIAAVLALAISIYRSPTSNITSLNTTYDRVIEAKQLRVGYLVLPPFLLKDTASGKFSGVFSDFIEEMGKQLDLKIIWVEEVSLATMVAGLDSGRYDMIAFPLWRNAIRAKSMAFSSPLFYATLGAYVRADDNRFNDNLGALNAENIKVSTMDGEVAETIAKEDLPLAGRVALPQFSDYSQLLLQVQTGKADVTFFDRVLAQNYLTKNPGKLKDVSGGQPVRVYAQTFILPLGDAKFESMISSATTVLVENGVLDRAFKKHNLDLGQFYKVAQPYEVPTWARSK